MSKCREVAGVLFKHECGLDAVAQCTRCRKPICQTHTRGSGYQTTCIQCLRDAAKDPTNRGNMAYLRDDPYFFWYFSGPNWDSDGYEPEDYTLFDTDDVAFGQGSDPEWRGS